MGRGGDTAQGALGGAMTGAAAGSAAGPYGALIGGAIGAIGGGLMGYFGSSGGQKYDEVLRQRLLQLEKDFAKSGPAAQAGYSDFRKNQAALIAQQEAMARGEGPSAAAMQMREAMDRATAAQSSLAAGSIGHGVNAGAALLAARNNAMAIQSQGARDLGLMRVNEQLGAIGLLGNTINQGRAGDEAVNMFNAHEQNAQAANIRSQQLAALQAAGGTAYGVTPSTGASILAGGASAYPAILQATGSTQNQPNAPLGTPGMNPNNFTVNGAPVWQPNQAGMPSDYAISNPYQTGFNPKP